jgi:hypothetical protein
MARFTSANAAAFAALRKTKGKRSAKQEILDIQRLLLIDIRATTTLPKDRAQCARAFDVLQERLRIMSGIPLPGQKRPDLELERAQGKRAHKRADVLPMPTVDPSSSAAEG